MEQSDIPKLQTALTLFHDDDRGCCIRSSLFDLEINITASGGDPKACAEAIRRMGQDLNNSALLVSRIKLMRKLAAELGQDQGPWRSYAQLDVEFFIIQLRSIMDYSVAVVDEFAPKKGQLPESFEKLRVGIDKFSTRLPVGVEDLIRGASWFDDMRTIRNSLIHGGGQSLVFDSTSDEYLFQIYGASMSRNLIFKPALMHNDNVVHFDKFSAWLFGCVLDYLNTLGDLFIDHCKPYFGIGPVSSYCPGFSDLRGWMQELVDQFLEPPSKPASDELAM